MVDGIPCLLLNYCWGLYFNLRLLYSILIKKTVVVVSAAPFDGTVDDIVSSLHPAVDTVVLHFVSVVSLCFAVKQCFLTLRKIIILDLFDFFHFPTS